MPRPSDLPKASNGGTKKIMTYPNHHEIVIATDVEGVEGLWQLGQAGWYKKGQVGVWYYPLDHIVKWKYETNKKNYEANKS